MSRQNSFLWLGGVFDDNTISNFQFMSPASNFWQLGFIDELQSQNHKIHVVGHAIERVWPLGKLNICKELMAFPAGLLGTSISYINLPFIRGPVQYLNYCRKASHFIKKDGLPDYLITFSCLNKGTEWSSTISTARRMKKKFGIPWICIVADGIAPSGADGYIYLTWSYSESVNAPFPKLHIDGGVPHLELNQNKQPQNNSITKPWILMYMGALTIHGGVSFLARAFSQLRAENVELWICGRGENQELIEIAEQDNRIKIIGFVSEYKLDQLAQTADAFANPRPSDFAPNKLNYPSKILRYLAYEKPVISTWTEGLSPEYSKVLISVNDETESAFSQAIQNAINMSAKDKVKISTSIKQFNKTHTWTYQIDKFSKWLNDIS